MFVDNWLKLCFPEIERNWNDLDIDYFVQSHFLVDNFFSKYWISFIYVLRQYHVLF